MMQGMWSGRYYRGVGGRIYSTLRGDGVGVFTVIVVAERTVHLRNRSAFLQQSTPRWSVL